MDAKVQAAGIQMDAVKNAATAARTMQDGGGDGKGGGGSSPEEDASNHGQALANDTGRAQAAVDVCLALTNGDGQALADDTGVARRRAMRSGNRMSVSPDSS